VSDSKKLTKIFQLYFSIILGCSNTWSPFYFSFQSTLQRIFISIYQLFHSTILWFCYCWNWPHTSNAWLWVLYINWL